MAAYIGHLVSLNLENEGGAFCGRLISHDHVQGKIVLSKVTCVTTGKKLPGNRTFFNDEIIPDSLVITDEVSSVKVQNSKVLKEKKSKSVEMRGSSCKKDNRTFPSNNDVGKETFELGAFFKYLERTDDPTQLPDNLVTSNLYKRLTALVSRDEWKNPTEKSSRPTRYIVIDKLGDLFDEAIFRINSEQSVGIAFTGVNISREGKLCWIQVATTDMVYIFDAHTMGHSCVSYGLDQVFSSSTILKVIHDCRWVSDLLFHQYKIKIVNVFDTQAAAVLVYRTFHGGDLPAYVKSLQTLVEEYLPIDPDEFHVFKIRLDFKETVEQMWSSRPMHDFVLDSLAKTVSYLNELRVLLERAMMDDFYVAMNSYVSVIRDQTDDEFAASPLPEKHRLPAVFTNMQRRDSRRSQTSRFRNQENRVNPDGFVETFDYPKEIIWRRDAISHSKTRKPHISSTSIDNKLPKKAPSYKYAIPPQLQKELPLSSSRDSPTRLTDSTSTTMKPLASPSPTKSTITSSPKSNTQKHTPLTYADSSSHSDSSQAKFANNTLYKEELSTYTAAESWQPLHESPTPSTSPVGADFSKLNQMSGPTGKNLRLKSVGRGKSTSSIKSALSSVGFSAIEGSGDSDSGVDSESRLSKAQPSSAINSVGLAAGFQNFEIMGTAPISLDNVPHEFDLRSASLKELKLLKDNKLTFNEPQVLENTSHHMPVTRHVLSKDGTIKDLDSGLKYYHGDAPSSSPPQNEDDNGPETYRCRTAVVSVNDQPQSALKFDTIQASEKLLNQVSDESDIEWDD